MAQRYGTIAAHTRRRASVLVVFVVFCVHMHSFASLMTLQSPSATLIPLFSSSELTGRGYPGLLDRKNRSDVCPPVGFEPSTSCKASTLSTRPGSPLPCGTSRLLKRRGRVLACRSTGPRIDPRPGHAVFRSP